MSNSAMSRNRQSLAGIRIAYFAPGFQCFVDFWLRKSGISPEPDFLALLPLPFDLRQQKLLPAIGAVNVSWPQLSGHAVALAVSLPRMRKLGLGSPSMLYSNRRNALFSNPALGLPQGRLGAVCLFFFKTTQ